jgi:DNA polymerase-3 subunit gamma/tau
MMAKTTKNPEKFIVCTPDELERYKKNGQAITYGSVLYIMETLCTESSQLKYSAHQRAKVETTLIRLCSPALSTDNSALVARIDELQAQIMMLKANGVSATPVTSQPQQTEIIRETSVIEESSPITETIQVSSETPLQSEKPQYTRDEEPPLPAEPPVMTPVIEEPVTPKAPVDMALVTESDKALPFTAWSNCVEQFGKINKPLYPMLQGSEAFRAGNTVFIKSKSPAFPALFKNKSNFDQIQEAIMRATGEKLRPAIYSDGESPAANENAEPVDVLISKLSKMQIDFIVEE